MSTRQPHLKHRVVGLLGAALLVLLAAEAWRDTRVTTQPAATHPAADMLTQAVSQQAAR